MVLVELLCTSHDGIRRSVGFKSGFLAIDDRLRFLQLHSFSDVGGVTAYATSMEAVLLHPAEPLPRAATLAFALGITLFVGGMAIALWRATGALALTRVVPILVTAIAIILAIGMRTVMTLAIALRYIVAIGVLE